MKDIGVKLKTYFQSKSFADFIYLVIVIVLVTMIKDMIMSMYKKRQDKRWLDTTFNKSKMTKQTKEVKEGFFTVPTCTSPADASSVCDRIKYLICEDNFSKIMKLMDNVDGTSQTLKFNNDVEFSSSLSCAKTAYFSSNLDCVGPVSSRSLSCTGAVSSGSLSCGTLTSTGTVTCDSLSTNQITNNKEDYIFLKHKEYSSESSHLGLSLYGNLTVIGKDPSHRYIQSYSIKTTNIYTSTTNENINFYYINTGRYLFSIRYYNDEEDDGKKVQLYDVVGNTYFKKTAGQKADKEN